MTDVPALRASDGDRERTALPVGGHRGLRGNDLPPGPARSGTQRELVA
jgi:hypothetical protein